MFFYENITFVFGVHNLFKLIEDGSREGAGNKRMAFSKKCV
jgi:hypothetical protein